MRIWRVTRVRYAVDVWGGTGGLHASGRWHPRGHRVVYAAEHPAICALEMLIHVERDLVPNDLLLCDAEVPDELVTSLAPHVLPPDWAAFPPSDSTRALGLAWLRAGASLALRVPSAVAPHSYNVLLNPLHPEASRLVPGSCSPWAPDTRLFGGP